jgi:hypothetical protein
MTPAAPPSTGKSGATKLVENTDLKHKKLRPFRFMDLPTEIRPTVYERLPVKTTHKCMAGRYGDPGLLAVTRSISGLSILRTCRLILSEASPIIDQKKAWIVSKPPRFLLDVHQCTNEGGISDRILHTLRGMVAYWTWHKVHPYLEIKTYEEARVDVVLSHVFKDTVLNPERCKLANHSLHNLRSCNPADDPRSLFDGSWSSGPSWTAEIALYEPRGRKVNAPAVFRDLLHIATGSRWEDEDFLFNLRRSGHPLHDQELIRNCDKIWSMRKKSEDHQDSYRGFFCGDDIDEKEWDRDWAKGKRF